MKGGLSNKEETAETWERRNGRRRNGRNLGKKKRSKPTKLPKKEKHRVSPFYFLPFLLCLGFA
jgi:hypothetical protein